MLMGAFSGCGNGNSGSSGAASKESTSGSKAVSESTAASEASGSKEVTLTLWQNSADTRAYTLEYQAKFQEEYPHIKLNLVQTPQDTDLLSAMASNTAPTIITNGYPQFSTLIYQGCFVNLDEYAQNDPDFKNYDTAQVEAFSKNGSVYGIPGGKYALGMAYNKTLLDEAGLTYPDKLPEGQWNWDKFYEYCVALTDPGKQQYGYALDIAQWGGWHFEMWAWAAGGEITAENADGTMSLTFTDPKNVVAGEFYRKLIDGNVIQSNKNAQIDELNKDFALGRAGFIISSMCDTSGAVNNGMKAEDIGFCNLPVGPSGKGYNIDGGDGTGIVYTTDKAVIEAAYTYLKFMGSKEVFEANYQEKADSGTWAPTISPRTDIDMAQFGDVDPYLQEQLDLAATVTRHEFYGKGAVGSFLDDAVAKFGGDSSTDILATLQEYQDKAQEKADEFNAQITG